MPPAGPRAECRPLRRKPLAEGGELARLAGDLVALGVEAGVGDEERTAGAGAPFEDAFEPRPRRLGRGARDRGEARAELGGAAFECRGLGGLRRVLRLEPARARRARARRAARRHAARRARTGRCAPPRASRRRGRASPPRRARPPPPRARRPHARATRPPRAPRRGAPRACPDTPRGTPRPPSHGPASPRPPHAARRARAARTPRRRRGARAPRRSGAAAPRSGPYRRATINSAPSSRIIASR